MPTTFVTARRIDPYPTFDTQMLATREEASGEGVRGPDASRDGGLLSSAPAPMTPAHAAPEQRAGETVGVGADLYALGCLLFELIAERVLGTGERAGPATPEAFPRSVRRRTRRDLAAIVTRAAAAEAADRYGSVSELTRDLDRLRDGVPVEARARSPLARMAYRLPRRVLATVLVGLFVFASGAAVAMLWGPTSEAESTRIANAAINALALEVAESARDGDTPEALLDRMLDRVGPDATRYNGFEGDLALTLAAAFDEDNGCSMAGPLYSRAAEVRRAISPRHPALAQALLGRSRCLQDTDSMLRVDGLAAVELAQEAVEILDATYGPESPITAVARIDLGHAWDAADDPEKGLELSLAAREILETADIRRSARRAMRVNRTLGGWILSKEVLIDEDWMIDRRMRALVSVASSYRLVERFDDAIALLERELAPLHATMRDRGWLDESTVWGYFVWAAALRSEGDWEEAQLRPKQWAEVADEVHGRDHWISAEAGSAVASVAIDRGQWDLAATLYGPIVEEAEALGNSGHLAVMLRRRAYALRQSGDLDASLRDLRRALSLSPDSMRVANYAVLHADLAQVLLDMDRPTEGLEAARRASELAETISGYVSARSLIDVAHARALVANGYPRLGLALAQEALAEAETRPESPGRSRALARAWSVIGSAQAGLGNDQASGEAEALTERLMAEGRPG